MLTKSFVAASSLSFCVAVTITSSFSANRFAVSFTTAKACGKIRFNTSSVLVMINSSRESIFLYKPSFLSVGVVARFASLFNSSISCFSLLVKSVIWFLKSLVFSLKSSFVKVLNLLNSKLIFSIIGVISFTSLSYLLPNNLLIIFNNPAMYSNCIRETNVLLLQEYTK